MVIYQCLRNIGQRTGVNDVILATLLLYLSVDMHRNWQVFSNCNQPVRTWLVGTYLLVASIRFARLVAGGVRDQEELDCILHHRCLGNLSWPLLAVWTFAGTWWTWRAQAQSKRCLTEPRHVVLVVTWIVAFYTWLFFYAWLAFMAWQHRRRLKWVKDNLRDVEDADLISRWGNVSDQPEEDAVRHGLTAAEIAGLPSQTAMCALVADSHDADCPICLCTLQVDDSVRQLDSCGHTFHRACIDLWLLRRAECPLCKTRVGASFACQRSDWNV